MPRILSFGRPAKASSNKHEAASIVVEATFSQQTISEKRPSITAMDLLQYAKDKRRSLSEKPPSRKGTPNPIVPKKAKLDINIESPPLVFYGNPSNSTGALLGGQLELEITDTDVKLLTFSMKLLATITAKKPVGKDCAKCASRSKQIFSWEFLSEPMTFPKGEHSFPFSHLLPGDLPHSTMSHLGGIEYSLQATATTATPDNISCSLPLTVKRALNPPSQNRTSLRIFPPTSLKVELVHPLIIYPIGEFACQFRMMCIAYKGQAAHFRWKLCRLSWEIREVTKLTSIACPKHAHRVGGEDKGLEYTDTRVVGHGELKKGWKTDFSVTSPTTIQSTPDPAQDPTTISTLGLIEMEFNCNVKANSHPACDVSDTANNIKVTHVLALEMIVDEEVSSRKNPGPNSFSATGTARVLRTQHQVILSDRMGLGISWDEEQPPMYEDVPSSPPGYGTSTIEDYTEGYPNGESAMDDFHLER